MQKLSLNMYWKIKSFIIYDIQVHANDSKKKNPIQQGNILSPLLLTNQSLCTLNKCVIMVSDHNKNVLSMFLTYLIFTTVFVFPF